MATIDSNPALPAAAAQGVFDELISEICTLECVLKVLEKAADDDENPQSGLSSAELVLGRSIRALHNIGSKVLNMGKAGAATGVIHE